MVLRRSTTVLAAAVVLAVLGVAGPRSAQTVVSRHALEGWDSAGRWDAKSFEPLTAPDGLRGFAYGTPAWAPAGGYRRGAVHARSWPTGALLWSLAGDGDGDQLGQEVFALGDLDGDGVPEVVATRGGGALVLDGATGRVLDAGPVAYLERLGDLDGDGVADLYRPREVFLGARRPTPLARLDFRTARLADPGWLEGLSGLEAASVGTWTTSRAVDDWDGDGLGDVLVGRGGSGRQPAPDALVDHRIGVYSSATGRWLGGRRGAGPTTGFGYVLEVVGDLTGDARAEVVVSEGDDLHLLDGATLETLRSYGAGALAERGAWAVLSGSFGGVLATVPDVTGNGVPELAVRFEAVLLGAVPVEASAGTPPAPRTTAGLALLDLASGAPVWTLVADHDLGLGHPHYPGATFAGTLRATPDLDGDGVGDLAARSWDHAEFLGTAPAGVRRLAGTGDGAAHVGATTSLAGRTEVELRFARAGAIGSAHLVVGRRPSREARPLRLVPERLIPGAAVRELGRRSWSATLPLDAPGTTADPRVLVQWVYRREGDAPPAWLVSDVLELTPRP